MVQQRPRREASNHRGIIDEFRTPAISGHRNLDLPRGSDQSPEGRPPSINPEEILWMWRQFRLSDVDLITEALNHHRPVAARDR
jgi:hypothetical protein